MLHLDNASDAEELYAGRCGVRLQQPEFAENDAHLTARRLSVRCDARQRQPFGLPQGAGDGHGKMIGRAKA